MWAETAADLKVAEVRNHRHHLVEFDGLLPLPSCCAFR